VATDQPDPQSNQPVVDARLNDGAHLPTGRGTTLEVVARASGFSRATVSRVVNGDRRVNEATRRAIERVVADLGYSPNPAARSLVTRRSDSVALVVPEPTTKLFGDPFFGRLVRGISEVLSERDLQLVLVAPQSPADERRLERYLTSGHVDGTLLVSLHGDDPLPRSLAARGTPVVIGGRPPQGLTASYVDVDNVAGARMAVDHLLASGRRTIAIVSGPPDMAAAADRLAGYHSALAAVGIASDPELVVDGDFDRERALERFAELYRRRPDIDAVFAASDHMAVGVLQAVRQSGRRVPGDVAIVGYDDSDLARSADPPLSSVHQPIEEMGREMSRLLLDNLGRRQIVARRVILATQLVVRASSGR
jgi:DNA-binding LacI/PurR family transcriptional regulator